MGQEFLNIQWDSYPDPVDKNNFILYVQAKFSIF